MADTVTTQTIQDGERTAVLKFTNVSDGTGESAVKKVDVSALASNSAGKECTEVHIQRIYWATVGMSVKLEFDASTNVLAIGLPADSTGDEYYDNFTAIPNNASLFPIFINVSELFPLLFHLLKENHQYLHLHQQLSPVVLLYLEV